MCVCVYVSVHLHACFARVNRVVLIYIVCVCMCGRAFDDAYFRIREVSVRVEKIRRLIYVEPVRRAHTRMIHARANAPGTYHIHICIYINLSAIIHVLSQSAF